MSNRTFACLHCRKLQRKPSVTPSVCCPHCGRECLCVHWKLHVPAPRKKRKWEKFWQQYLLELRLIEQFEGGAGPDTLYLPLLNQYRVRASVTAVRKRERDNERRARRKKLARRRERA
jgi:hypothetical protein